MPDFDLLIELAKYYKVEVSEILDGERKGGRTDGSAEELMLKIADYSNIEPGKFFREECVPCLLWHLPAWLFLRRWT